MRALLERGRISGAPAGAAAADSRPISILPELLSVALLLRRGVSGEICQLEQ